MTDHKTLFGTDLMDMIQSRLFISLTTDPNTIPLAEDKKGGSRQRKKKRNNKAIIIKK